jgi:hypothetical protein
VNPQTAGLVRIRSDSNLWFVGSWPAEIAFLPRQLGQVMNPLLVWLAHLWHRATTTQNGLRFSPVPWHSGHMMTPLALHLVQGSVSVVDCGDS